MPFPKKKEELNFILKFKLDLKLLKNVVVEQESASTKIAAEEVGTLIIEVCAGDLIQLMENIRETLTLLQVFFSVV